jgi:glycosyltransferase involved in cell wall biosynthesis
VIVGVDGACWANRRGYGRFAREIHGAMVRSSPDDEFVCFVDEAARACAPLEAPNVRFVTVPQSRPPTAAASSDGARSVRDVLRFTRAVWRARVDVFFSPSVYTYFPLPPTLPAVVTIHDAIAERFPHLTLPSRRARIFWAAKVRFALMQASLVLTVSDHARKDVASIHRFPSDRIRVAVEAPAEGYRPIRDERAIRARAESVGLPAAARWLTYVGGFNPHKNVDVIVRAHARHVRGDTSGEPLHLLLVGPTEGDVFHGNLAKIRETVAAMGTTRLVHWPGFVPDEDLAHLHSGAVALLLPSEAEGFGLPAVEAAACGCPVIATTESPLPELLVGGGVFVHPGDEGALFDAISLLVDDPEARATFGRKAEDRARALSWCRAAGVAMDALRTAAT